MGVLSRVRRWKEYGNESRCGSVVSLDLYEEKENMNDSDDDLDVCVYIVISWWEWWKLKWRLFLSLIKSEEIKMFKIEKDFWWLWCDVESDLYFVVKRRFEEVRLLNLDEDYD